MRLSYPDERWVRLAQESYPAGARSRRSWDGRCSSCTGRSISATGSRTARRWSRAGSRSRCSTRPRSGAGSGSVSRQARAGSSRRTAGSSVRTWRCRRCSSRRGPPVRRCERACAIDSVEADGDLVSLGGLQRPLRRRDRRRLGTRARRRRRDPDARDGVVLRARRAGALGDRREGRRGTALRAARARPSASRPACTRPGPRPIPTSRVSRMRRSPSGQPTGSAVASPLPASCSVGDVPLHDPHGRRVRARAPRPRRRRVALQRPRLQVRPRRRRASRRARGRGPLAEEVAVGRHDAGRGPSPRPRSSTPRTIAAGIAPSLPEHELGGARELVGDGDLRRAQLVADRVARRRAGRAAASTPATPSATSVVPCRNGRPNESLTITPTSRPVRSRRPVTDAARPTRRGRAAAARACPAPSRSTRRRPAEAQTKP